MMVSSVALLVLTLRAAATAFPSPITSGNYGSSAFSLGHAPQPYYVIHPSHAVASNVSPAQSPLFQPLAQSFAPAPAYSHSTVEVTLTHQDSPGYTGAAVPNGPTGPTFEVLADPSTREYTGSGAQTESQQSVDFQNSNSPAQGTGTEHTRTDSQSLNNEQSNGEALGAPIPALSSGGAPLQNTQGRPTRSPKSHPQRKRSGGKVPTNKERAGETSMEGAVDILVQELMRTASAVDFTTVKKTGPRKRGQGRSRQNGSARLSGTKKPQKGSKKSLRSGAPNSEEQGAIIGLSLQRQLESAEYARIKPVIGSMELVSKRAHKRAPSIQGSSVRVKLTQHLLPNTEEDLDDRGDNSENQDPNPSSPLSSARAQDSPEDCDSESCEDSPSPSNAAVKPENDVNENQLGPATTAPAQVSGKSQIDDSSSEEDEHDSVLIEHTSQNTQTSSLTQPQALTAKKSSGGGNFQKSNNRKSKAGKSNKETSSEDSASDESTSVETPSSGANDLGDAPRSNNSKEKTAPKTRKNKNKSKNSSRPKTEQRRKDGYSSGRSEVPRPQYGPPQPNLENTAPVAHSGYSFDQVSPSAGYSGILIERPRAEELVVSNLISALKTTQVVTTPAPPQPPAQHGSEQFQPHPGPALAAAPAPGYVNSPLAGPFLPVQTYPLPQLYTVTSSLPYGVPRPLTRDDLTSLAPAVATPSNAQSGPVVQGQLAQLPPSPSVQYGPPHVLDGGRLLLQNPVPSGVRVQPISTNGVSLPGSPDTSFNTGIPPKITETLQGVTNGVEYQLTPALRYEVDRGYKVVPSRDDQPPITITYLAPRNAPLSSHAHQVFQSSPTPLPSVQYGPPPAQYTLGAPGVRLGTNAPRVGTRYAPSLTSSDPENAAAPLKDTLALVARFAAAQARRTSPSKSGERPAPQFSLLPSQTYHTNDHSDVIYGRPGNGLPSVNARSSQSLLGRYGAPAPSITSISIAYTTAGPPEDIPVKVERGGTKDSLFKTIENIIRSTV